jgi:DEAD/DEAH box helicase domain-containing protein
VPVLEALLTEKGGRAIYLFPTKALAQDQLRSLRELTSPGLVSLRYDTFDGDTPQEARAEIKRSAQVVLTNPDMLHLGILPNHSTWSRLLGNLKYVVIDEAHVYRGVFGSHVADVLRRLRRLCAVYGSQPRFILCSATIANPGEHASRLVGLPFEVVEQDGSPRGGKDFVFWNPPIIDSARSARRSANSEATLIFQELVRQSIRSLTFARSRHQAELIYLYTRRQLAETDPSLADRIKPYRAGYLAEERRQIERELFEGRLLGVVATTALELGVDIGDLDATVLTGYPGTIASTWQQAGRAGRGREDSLSFLVALNNPLDQYLMRHPEAFFGKSHENALIDPGNPHILKPHLLCAAHELPPLSDADEGFFEQGFGRAREELEGEGLLRSGRRLLRSRGVEMGRGRRWYLAPHLHYPAQDINIRSASSQNYLIVDASRGTPLETVEAAVAFFQIHPGAIYLHQGEPYLITQLDLARRTAYATPTDVSYYTQTRDLTELRVLKQTRQRQTPRAGVYLGEVEVTTQVVGYKKKRVFTDEVIGEELLELPPYTFPTVALWFDLAAGTVERITEAALDFAGGLHAAEHAAIGILPLFAMCDRNDIGGVSTPAHADTGKPQIFIYDGYPGGVGIAEKGYELVEELWQATLKAITECPCEEGCPSCVQSPKCGNNNQPLDKKGAQLILEGLVGGWSGKGRV